MLLAGSVNSDWYLGLTLGFVIVTVVVLVVAVILSYAGRIAEQAWAANEGLDDIRGRTEPLAGVRNTNATGLALLAAAKSAREAVVVKVTGAPPAPAPVPPGPTGPAPASSPFDAPPPSDASVEPLTARDAESFPAGGRFSREEAPAEDPPRALRWGSDAGGRGRS